MTVRNRKTVGILQNQRFQGNDQRINAFGKIRYTAAKFVTLFCNDLKFALRCDIFSVQSQSPYSMISDLNTVEVSLY